MHGSGKGVKPRRFSAEDYRKMAARFDLMHADNDGLTVCEWWNNNVSAIDDGDYIPSQDERTVKEMLLCAAKMAEERNTRMTSK